MTAMFRCIALALVLALSFVTAAAAGQVVPYDAAAFASAKAAGAPVVIHVTAPWCPTCRAQHPVVDQLVTEPAHDDLIVFNVDFDSQKDVLRELNVRSQSTFIAYRGAKETDRSVGITNPAAIAALFNTTL